MSRRTKLHAIGKDYAANGRTRCGLWGLSLTTTPATLLVRAASVRLLAMHATRRHATARRGPA
jgi:hypothetical protein